MRRKELESKTKKELVETARRLGVPGRSQLPKDELVRAIMKAGAKRKSTAKPKPVKRAVEPKARRVKKSKARAKTAPRAKRTKVARPKAALAKKRGPARKAVAPATRRGRGGPYGPEADRLHGGVLPPALEEPEVRARPGEPVPRGAGLEMPERYGRDYAVLMVRDPYWIHAYWEVTDKTFDRARQELADEWEDHRWVIRVFSFPPDTSPAELERGEAEDRYDIDLPPGTRSWYLNVRRPEWVYMIAVGIMTHSGKFRALVRSNAVRTPRDSYSTVTDEEWTRFPAELERLYDMLRPTLLGESSAELRMLLRERFGADWSSGMLGSMGSGALGRPDVEREGFWFVLDAELLVYGATAPDAKVTIQSRPVELRPDGTFSMRFQLPDGKQVIEAKAVSGDGRLEKTITPTVEKKTRSTEAERTRVES